MRMETSEPQYQSFQYVGHTMRTQFLPSQNKPILGLCATFAMSVGAYYKGPECIIVRAPVFHNFFAFIVNRKANVVKMVELIYA